VLDGRRFQTHVTVAIATAYLHEANTLAGELANEQAPEEHSLDAELETLKFFSVPEPSVVNQ